MVAAGGDLRQLILAYALVGALTAAGVVVWRRRRAVPPAAEGPAADATASAPNPRLAQGSGLALGLVGVLVFLATGSAVALWWWAVLLLGAAAAVFLLAEPPVARPALRGPGLEAGLWALGIACVALTLIVHRPDIDDAFYINVAVAAADAPGRALLGGDTLHGIDGLPLHLAVYRLHTYELLVGAFAYLTGIPAIYWFHWIFASVGALLVVLAHAVLFRLLTPRRWLWAVAGLVFVLLAVGETHRWYGNFAFVRIWQGKGFFLFVFMPLVYAYAIRFALRPSPASWLLLAAAQIGAVGCSFSGVWVAPAGAFVAMACALRPTRAGARTLALGGLASVYVLAVGWLLKEEMQGALPLAKHVYERGVLLDEALITFLGSARLRAFGVASILVAWALCGRGLARRFAIAFPLVVGLVFLSPYWDHWVLANVTGTSYWRALWSLPVPILMVLVLISPLRLDGRRSWRVAGRVACILSFAAFAAFVPRFGGLSERNHGATRIPLRVGAPSLKVPLGAYAWARSLNASVPAGSAVVAPLSVSVWLPTLHEHAHPLVVRTPYLKPHRSRLGDEQVLHRYLMTSYVAGVERRDDAARLFRSGLRRFDVKGVCLRKTALAEQARNILRSAGFRRSLQGADHEIWVRS